METTKSLNRIKTSELLRTTGAVTGNFGRSKVKAGSTLQEIGNSSRENVGNFPSPNEYIQRLYAALQKTDDPKLRAFLHSEIRKHQLRQIQDDRRIHNPQGPFCELRTRQYRAGR